MGNVYNETSQDAAATAGQEIVTETDDKAQTGDVYSFKDNETYVNGVKIANFKLEIDHIKQLEDSGVRCGDIYCMKIWLKDRESQFDLPSDKFRNGCLMQSIRRVIGPEAWLIGSEQQLILAIQQNLTGTILRERISLSTGFDENFSEFLLPGIRITSEGIQYKRQPIVLLPERFVGKIAIFQEIEEREITALMQHIFIEFAALKSNKVMLPLIGHLGIAVLATWIGNYLGKQKYTLYLKGLSGGGKTFIASLVASFFGNSGDRLMSWSSTANAIESEGYHSKDQMFIVDDYKKSVTSPKELTRVLQNYADNHGRSRLTSSSLKASSPHIRGFLLSTGEDFVENVESVSGRTIVLDVEPEHKQEAGDACRSMQHLYNGLLPRFIHWLISQESWQENLKNQIESMIEELFPLVNGISNGLRMVTNWAINAAGFQLFCRFAVHVNAIDDTRCLRLFNEYIEVVEGHLQSQEATMKAQNPVSIFFGMLEQLISTEAVFIEGLNGIKQDKPDAYLKTKTIGKVVDEKVYIFHDLAMSHLIIHSKKLNHVLPFTKENLRSALANEEVLIKQNGRLSIQVRHNNGRAQAWQFDLSEFKKRCTDVDGE